MTQLELEQKKLIATASAGTCKCLTKKAEAEAEGRRNEGNARGQRGVAYLEELELLEAVAGDNVHILKAVGPGVAAESI